MITTDKPNIPVQDIRAYSCLDQILMAIENSPSYSFTAIDGHYVSTPRFWAGQDNCLGVLVGKGEMNVGFFQSFFCIQPNNTRMVLGRFNFQHIQGKTVPFYLSCASVQPQAQTMLEYIQSQCPDLDFVIRMNWPMSPKEEIYYSCE